MAFAGVRNNIRDFAALRKPGSSGRASTPRIRLLSVLAGHPQDVVATVLIGQPGPDEQQVRQPIEIDQHLQVDFFFLREGRDADLHPAANGSGQMQGGCGRRTARQNETGQRRETGSGLIDPGFQLQHLGFRDP
jgi:hypothetical protein